MAGRLHSWLDMNQSPFRIALGVVLVLQLLLTLAFVVGSIAVARLDAPWAPSPLAALPSAAFGIVLAWCCAVALRWHPTRPAAARALGRAVGMMLGIEALGGVVMSGSWTGAVFGGVLGAAVLVTTWIAGGGGRRHPTPERAVVARAS